MPELPEVYTIVNDLNLNAAQYTIGTASISAEYNVYPSNDLFISTVTGKKILGFDRVAKNIVFRLEGNIFINIHLAMTGRILLRDPEHGKDAWVKLLMKIHKDNEVKYLKFADMRMFGKVSLLNQTEFAKFKEKYGPEPMDTSIDPQKFLDILRAKKTTIKNVLLDQSAISGMGNIYVTDALFLANIHPETHTKDITPAMAEKLLLSARHVLIQGIKNRGSTLPDGMFVDIFGNSGSHQKHFEIYMKEKCPKCSSKIVYKKIAGRGTYLCPTCQPFGQKTLFQ